MRAFSIHTGPPLSLSRVKCVDHNRELIDLEMVGLEHDELVKSQGIRVNTYTSYSEVLRLLLLSREPDLLYLDTDCWLVEIPIFKSPGKSSKSNWAMYSGDRPELFSTLLDNHKARGHVYEAADHKMLSIAGAKTINAIHKWEIPWFKE